MEFIAYEGEAFCIEWYFNENGKCDTLDYFEDLPEDIQLKTLTLFKRMGETGAIKDKTKFNHEGDGLYAFKPAPHRFLCFFVKGRKIIVTSGFQKQSQKLPAKEKNRALERKKDYERRSKKGDYYPNNI